MKKFHHLHWFFLFLGIAAGIGLTGMNVYSLYALHEYTVTNSVENQKRQLLEFSNQVRNRFRYSLNDLWQVNMDELQYRFETSGQISEELRGIIRNVSNDSLYTRIYMASSDCNVCDRHGAPVRVYNPVTGQFEVTTDYSHLVSDGFTIAQTRMRTLINEYRWNTRIIFDAHRSMTIILINRDRQEIVAYLNFLINQDYLINSYLKPKLVSTFGSGSSTGIVVWLHDWTQNEVLASTNEGIAYNYQKVDFIQNFPDQLNDWNLKAQFTEDPVISASRASLTRNLVILGGAVVILIGAFVFIFIAIQRERSLAQRQAMFLANVTHELKTPLSVILAAGENLSDGRVKDRNRLKLYGSHIYSESERLRSMIDRLLDVARFDTNSAQVNKKWINASLFTRNLLDNKRKFLESLGFKVSFDAAKNLPEIQIDTDDLTTIIENLIDNAIKYSPDEKYLGIRVYQNKQKLYIEIRDHGIGISRKSQKYLFDKFYRVENSATSQSRGHGLGLSIVKDLMNRYNGKIQVDSAIGKGSVFTLIFPVFKEQIQAGATINKHPINKEASEHVH